MHEINEKKKEFVTEVKQRTSNFHMLVFYKYELYVFDNDEFKKRIEKRAKVKFLRYETISFENKNKRFK